MNFSKNKGLEALKEIEEEVTEDPDTFNSFLADLEEEQRMESKPRSTTDSELLSMMLMELKKISAALSAGVSGSMKNKGNDFKKTTDGEETTVKAKIAEWEDKGKFIRVKIATKPVIWASCWDESIAADIVEEIIGKTLLDEDSDELVLLVASYCFRLRFAVTEIGNGTRKNSVITAESYFYGVLLTEIYDSNRKRISGIIPKLRS